MTRTTTTRTERGRLIRDNEDRDVEWGAMGGDDEDGRPMTSTHHYHCEHLLAGWMGGLGNEGEMRKTATSGSQGLTMGQVGDGREG